MALHKDNLMEVVGLHFESHKINQCVWYLTTCSHRILRRRIARWNLEVYLVHIQGIIQARERHCTNADKGPVLKRWAVATTPTTLFTFY